jgi:hypothetical protein
LNDSNMATTLYDCATMSQTFTSMKGATYCDVRIQFLSGNIRFDVYENGASTPTRTKQCYVGPPADATVGCPG